MSDDLWKTACTHKADRALIVWTFSIEPFASVVFANFSVDDRMRFISGQPNPNETAGSKRYIDVGSLPVIIRHRGRRSVSLRVSYLPRNAISVYIFLSARAQSRTGNLYRRWTIIRVSDVPTESRSSSSSFCPCPSPRASRCRVSFSPCGGQTQTDNINAESQPWTVSEEFGVAVA